MRKANEEKKMEEHEIAKRKCRLKSEGDEERRRNITLIGFDIQHLL